MHRAATLFVGAIWLSLFALAVAGEASPSITVIAFNIRYGTAKDGENHWDKRKEFVAETILAAKPDLLGTQETLGFQRDYLAEKLPGYDSLGVGRDDGGERGEMMALFYRKDRFKKLDGGHFWLSESPDKVGSKSWDSSLPRMATWVKLEDLKQAGAKPVLFINTHFDHLGKVARFESAKLLRQRATTLGEGCSVIVTGDFNTGEASPPYDALFGEVEGEQSPVVDAYRTVNTERQNDEGTFTGFKAGPVKGDRIDWIGASRDWTIAAASIDRTERAGRTPSDHFPVIAVLKRKD